MAVASYLLGVGCVAVVVIATITAGRAVARRLLPTATGAMGAAATAVGGVTVLLLTAEALGTIGLLRRAALVPVLAVVGVVAEVSRRRLGRPASRSAPPIAANASLSPAAVLAVVAVAILVAQALVAVRDSASTGILHIDALEYHLTTAAHFAATHRTTSYVHVSFGDSITYYPFNAELLHGVGMIALGRDSLSLLSGCLDIGLLLLAAYALGEEYDAGPVAVCAITPVLAVLGRFDASALNDWASLWPFVAGIGFAVHAWRRERRLPLGAVAMAGLGLGLAAGTKADVLAPAVIAGIGVLVLAARRGRALGVLVGTGLLGGGYWYVRNTIRVGSPVPSTHLPGLPRIPMSLFRQFGFTVARYLGNSHVWRTYFVPGLHVFFGRAWIPVLAATGIGMVVALRPGGDRALRVFSAVAILCIGAYVISPSSALGVLGAPSGFSINLRYALPAVVLGLLLFALAMRPPRLAPVAALGFLVCSAVTVTVAGRWAESASRTRVEALAIALIGCGLVVRPEVRRHARGAIAGAVVMAAVAGYPLQQHYLHHRYASTDTAAQALMHAVPAGAHLRIGVVGRPVEYPFLGPHWSNSVTYVAQPLADHAYELYPDCADWRRAAGGYDVIVVATLGAYSAPAYRWTSTDPAARVLFHDPAGTVFGISRGFASQPCGVQ